MGFLTQGPHLIYGQVNWAMPLSVALIGWDPARDPHKICVGSREIRGTQPNRPEGTLVTGARPANLLRGGCGNWLPPIYPTLAKSYS